ncbi:ATP-binding protein [Deltaproteobacteria bacterium TL4]
MRRTRLIWYLYPSYLLITLIAVLAVGWYASKSFRTFYFEQTASALATQAKLFRSRIIKEVVKKNYGLLDHYCKEYGELTLTRFTIILPSGVVVGDSYENPALMENHAERPEIQSALKTGQGHAIRDSSSLNKKMMNVAILVNSPEETYGVIRASVPLVSIGRALSELHVKILIGCVVIAVFLAGLSLGISRLISRPLEEIKKGAERFAKGDLNHRLPLPNTEETRGLVVVLNDMAAQLDDRLCTIVQQYNEKEAILSSMIEGVIAVDSKARFININQAAASMFGLDPLVIRGRYLQEFIRNVELQRVVVKALTSHLPLENEILLLETPARILNVYGTSLRSRAGEQTGALIVLHDITKIRHLETMRQEFVANVSHELKTPVTSIKAAIETLLEGAKEHPKDLDYFLSMIERQANRITAIIESLLVLSKLEQEERVDVVLEPTLLKKVLETSIHYCSQKASEKNIQIQLQCAEDLAVELKPLLFEQAISNLIDNAIKYSEASTSISIEALAKQEEILISVQDQGSGIEEKHLSRLFERFYRVDKSRNRKIGGSGLGLAIVKHISQIHKGRVSVKSIPGKGSIFTIHLPAAHSMRKPVDTIVDS